MRVVTARLSLTALSACLLAGLLWSPAFADGPTAEALVRQDPEDSRGRRGESTGEPGAPARPETGHFKGWLQTRPGGNLGTLPPGARVVESYDGRLFVEMPRAAMSGLAARGLIFKPVPGADVLSIGGHRFDVRDGEPGIDARWKASVPASRRPHVLKFKAPVKPEWLDEIRAAGGELVQYQPHFGYLIFGGPQTRSALKSMNRLAFHGEYHGAYKADPALRSRVDSGETITLRITYFDLPGYTQRIDALLANGGRLAFLEEAASTSQWALLHYAVIENVRTSDLPEILGHPEVYWAEEWVPARLEGERAAQITAGNIAGGIPVTGYHTWLAGLGADGSGVTVVVADTGLDSGDPNNIHPDFVGRVSFATALCANSRDQNGHGTNVAGIAVGDPRGPTGTGLLDPGGFFYGSGSAPGADLYFQKALNDGDCPQSWAGQPNTLASNAVTAGGAQLGTHSFTDGASPGNGYTTNAQVWDARVRDADTGVAGHQPYAVIFSAGNSGPSAGTLTSPKAAKNIVSVGASENYRPTQCPSDPGCGGDADDIDTLVAFSSRGPTVDGRFKPEVSTPGHVIVGPRSSAASYSCFCDGGGGGGCCASTGVDGSNEYTAYSGTSQASPRAAGASAVIFDWYQGQFGAFPSPAMNKAILISGATDMGAADTPNNDEGWGRVNLKGSLQSGLPTVYVDQSTLVGTPGAGNGFGATYWVQDVNSPVTAIAAWTDAPGAVNCNPCLVNDLDLSLTDGTDTWNGNNLAAGFSTTSPLTDTLNNVEAVRLPGGSVCLPFTVNVDASTLGGDGVPGNGDATDQDFALVVTNAGASAGPTALQVTGSSTANGCDADVFLDRRETVDLTVDAGNCGAAASGVSATLSVDSAPAGAVITVSPPGAQSIGAIGAGGSAQKIWQVSLADDASSFCGETATLRVDFSDANSLWSDTVDIILDADAFGLVTETDPVDVDNAFSSDVEWNLDNCRTTSSPTSWHMGNSDCTGIPRDAASRDLIFEFTVGSTDIIRELSFQHAFNGYQNGAGTLRDSVQIDIDPENDGTYVTLESWQSGLNNPGSMSPAGPYDLSAFDASRANTFKVRFRFQSAANWVGGPNNAPGWDVDDIVFKYDTLTCDTGSCPACSLPSAINNNGAADALSCAVTGNLVSWDQDAGVWGDGGVGARSYSILRDGGAIVSGGCSGSFTYATTSCTDTTATPGLAHTYAVEYHNGCASVGTTAGAIATDLAGPPPEVNDGTGAGSPVEITMSGSAITLMWDAQICAAGYNVYRGSLGGLYDHAIFSATGLDGADSCLEPGTSVTFTDPAPGTSHYFLVATDNGSLESGYDDTTVVAPRPYASPACNPH